MKAKISLLVFSVYLINCAPMMVIPTQMSFSNMNCTSEKPIKPIKKGKNQWELKEVTLNCTEK